MKLLSENRTLQKKYSSLYATSSKKQRRGADEDKLGYKSEVVRWAKRLLFTRALCINVTAFQAKPADTLDLTQPEDQFASEDAYVQSITAALYQEIPEKFHSLVDSAMYGSFARTVRNLTVESTNSHH